MVEIRWAEPLGANGVITQYAIERKLASGSNVTTVSIFPPNSSMVYIDDSMLLAPYTAYSYRINVINSAGTGVGPWGNITTSSSRNYHDDDDEEEEEEKEEDDDDDD
jgi:hypothetical protein